MGAVINMPYSPDWVDYLNQAGKTFGNLIQQRNQVLMREIAQRAFMDMLQQNPNYRWRTYYNPLTGNVTYSVAPRVTKQSKPLNLADKAKEDLGIMAEVINPSQVYSQEQLNKMPQMISNTPDGNAVLAEPGAITIDGTTYSPNDPMLKYYTPEEIAQAKKFPPATGIIPSMLRARTGISKEEAVRKFYGLRAPKKAEGSNRTKSSVKEEVNALRKKEREASSTVRIITPDGQQWLISRDKLPEAIRRGAKVIK